MIINPIDNKKVISITYNFQCGFLHEPNKYNHYTHVIEHIIGSFLHKNLCSFKDVESYTKPFIFTTNAYTTNNSMAVWIKTTPKYFKKTLKLLSNSIFDICISDQVLLYIKKDVIQEILEDEDTFIPDLYQLLFNKDFYNKSCIQDVNDITTQSLSQFYQEMLKNSKQIISISCHSSKTSLYSSYIKQLFNKNISTSTTSLIASYKILPPSKPTTVKIYKPIKTVLIKISIPLSSKPLSTSCIALHILSLYLFDFLKGPFYKHLRHNQSLIYSVSHYYMKDKTNHNNNIYVITTSCSKNNIDKTIDIIHNILKEIHRVDQDTFNYFKKQFIFNISYNMMNNIDSYEDFYNSQILYDNSYISYQEYEQLCHSVQFTDFVHISKQLQKSYLSNSYTFLYSNSYPRLHPPKA